MDDTSTIIFFHHMDLFEMNSIKKRLVEENLKLNFLKYDIYGSLYQKENLIEVMHGRHPIDILEQTDDKYIAKIINCDIIVFTADSLNFEQVCTDLRKVLSALEAWANEQKKSDDAGDSIHLKKYLILLSTPMTWALTKPNISTNEEEEEPEINGLLYEDDYRRRRAHPSYCKHKILERDVIWLQKRCKPYVKTLVVCPGVTYGGKNNKFHYLFKLAFYNKEVPIVRPGSQLIPMIYLKDYVEIMKDIFDHFPDSKHRYIFAVQPTLVPFKSLAYQICKSFNGDCSKIRFVREVELLMKDEQLFSQNIMDALSLNIRLTPTYLKDYQFQEINDELWDKLAKEFRESRNLHPLRIVIDGPPLVGKTMHAKKLAESYQLIYIDIRTIINTYIKYLEQKIADSITLVDTFECPSQIMLGYEDDADEEEEAGIKKPSSEFRAEEDLSTKFDPEDEYLIEELKYRISKWSAELFRIKVYVASHKTFEDQDFDHISQCLISLISNKQYNDNQGYIIDEFPFTYEQASQIFYKTRRVDDPFPPSDELDEDKTYHKITIPPPPTPLTPTNFIMLDAPDDLLRKRAMGFTETEATIRRCLRHQMLPRLDAYRERNDEPFCLANIFYDNHLIPISIFVENSTFATDTLRAMKSEIGSPFIYPLSEEQQKANKKIAAEKQLKEEEEQSRKKKELVISLTLQRERKLLEWSKRYEELRKHENEVREIKTLPLRQYLGKYILPTLTEGILKVAELKPDDPVDFLADYLFKVNPEGQQMPPFCTEEQKKRFFSTFFDDLTSDSEYFIDKEK